MLRSSSPCGGSCAEAACSEADASDCREFPKGFRFSREVISGFSSSAVEASCACWFSGDIGCYTLGVLPPFNAVDTCVCMGASITAGLGMRHVLPEEQARKVVSVIGDSTFLHTGINGIVDMVYNRPTTGHVVVIVDNSTTAMTGMQENPATGRKLDHTPAPQISLENVVKAIGVDHVDIIDTTAEPERFADLLKNRLASNDLSVIIARRPCILAAVKIRAYEAANTAKEN